MIDSVASPATAPARPSLAASLAALYNCTSDAVYVVDSTGRCIFINPAAMLLFGLSREPIGMLAGEFDRDADSKHSSPIGIAARALKARAPVRTMGASLLRADRTQRAVERCAFPVMDAGQLTGVVVTLRDQSREQQLEKERELAMAILEKTPDVVSMCTLDGRITFLNAAGRRTLGVSPGAVRNRLEITRAYSPETLKKLLIEAMPALVRDGSWHGETMLRHQDGREIPVSQVALAHRDAKGEIEYLSTIMRDITEKRQAEAQLRALSLEDALTGLRNRRGFETLAEQQLKLARRGKAPVLFFFGDVDRFKSINDTHGHAVGDRALQAVANALRETFRETDVLARLGGDEFAALIINAGPETEEQLLGRLHRNLARLAAKLPHELSVTFGVAAFDWEMPETLAALGERADAALYAKKRARRTAMA